MIDVHEMEKVAKDGLGWVLVEWDSKVANNTISNGIVPLEKELILVLLYFQCDFMSASKQQNIQQALQIAQNLTSNP